MTDTLEIDPRYVCAKAHADAIQAAAKALNDAIYMASRDGYSAVVRLKEGFDMGEGRFVGTANPPIHIAATITFDIGKAV